MSKVCTFALLNRICKLKFTQKAGVEAKICKQYMMVVGTVTHKLK